MQCFDYLQAMFVVEEGSSIEEVDQTMEDFGFAMGPFKVRDLSGNLFCILFNAFFSNTRVMQCNVKTSGINETYSSYELQGHDTKKVMIIRNAAISW